MQNLEKTIKPLGDSPASSWDPPFCGDMNILIGRDGSWFHEGRLIRRKKLVQLFSTIIRLEKDGQYYLVSPSEKLRIQVEDCPFVVNQMDVKFDEDNQIIVYKTPWLECLMLALPMFTYQKIVSDACLHLFAVIFFPQGSLF